MTGNLTTLKFHSNREKLFNELHTRPFPLIDTPAKVSQLAVLHEIDDEDKHQTVASQFDHLSSLCERYTVNPPAPDASCYYQDFGGFELRWERHTEFTTYTFIRKAMSNRPFDENALSVLPDEWLASIPGKIISGLHIEVAAMPGKMPSTEALRHHFEGHRMIGSELSNGAVQLWTSYRIHSDGMGRILIFNKGFDPCEGGRLVRRLLEIETYRMMVLIAFPIAQSTSPEVRAMASQVVAVNQQINEIEGLEDERRLLAELSSLAARLEQIISDTNFRFSAAEAYYALVLSRIGELNETPIPGFQTIGEFLGRRLIPAYRTCETTRRELTELSVRIDRASDLIRTRVNVTIESQNRYLLQSMDRRSKLQLRMQQAVEGLSVAVISYHLVGLVKFAADSAKELGFIENSYWIIGASVPISIGAVVFGLIKLKKRIYQVNKEMKAKQRSLQ
ncbi:MAG: hypothetical protein CSB48_05000 [Proteobacteria bacterium]|nr:MAG: hypothetical protein CSB48_05000 [Pseudomonadota bacterium]